MSRALRVSTWVALGVLVGLTVAVVAVDGPLPGEIGLIRRLQSFGEPVPTFADIVRATTGTEGNLVVGAPAGVWLVARHGRTGWAVVVVCLASMLIVQPVSKELIDRDRPDESQVEVRADHSSRAYPSGHSLSTATTWGAAALYASRTGRRRLAGALTVPIVCTALASGIHGVHWASDAIAGTLMGLGAAWLAIEQVAPNRPHERGGG
ncbi:MAG: phosphatase PAP2 family protein [Actinomycetota bacterium]